MPLPDDIGEFTPGYAYREGDPSTLYWIRDGVILYRSYPLRGAHIPSFQFYLGSFAKDRKNCYCSNSRLRGGNGGTFRAINFCYATDGQLVWTMGGQVKAADAESFVVCDDGVLQLSRGVRAPYGFGKDHERVYYYGFDGKPNWVRKATAESFESLNDGNFGNDANFVFCRAATIPNANVQFWPMNVSSNCMI